MTTLLLTHPACLLHTNPPSHPERVDRLRVINDALSENSFADLLREEAPLAQDADVLLAHPKTYVERIKAAAPHEGYHALDPDTHMSTGTLEAAYRAIGATLRGVDQVLGGAVRNAFCAIRPPGHHAEAEKPMGFCIFGNVSIAAKHALERHGLTRVAIVDFDVHHGNGTQNLVWDDPRIFFASTHQMPLYPGSGHATETGGHGNIVNVPLEPGSGGAVFRREVLQNILPALRAHRPELILISAGFDAHRSDPLAQLGLLEADYIWITNQICDVADEFANGRVVSTLEGGYDLEALASSVAAHVSVLMERGG